MVGCGEFDWPFISFRERIDTGCIERVRYESVYVCASYRGVVATAAGWSAAGREPGCQEKSGTVLFRISDTAERVFADAILVLEREVGRPNGALLLELRCEVFNLCNTTEFAPPNATVDIPGLSGSISSTVHSSRQMQIAVRFKF
jgi:hypothetical protein